MSFVKLDCDMLDSSLWDWTPERHIFITALLMAKPCEIKEASPQLAADSLSLTGWIVPPGKYGLVRASGAMIVKKALSLSHIDRLDNNEEFTEALEALGALGRPDEDSRSQAFEGRRLVRIDGGYLVLNFQHYRDKDHTATERKRRQREREKEATSRRDVTDSHKTSRRVTQAEAQAEAEADTKEDKEKEVATASPSGTKPVDLRKVHPVINGIWQITGIYPPKEIWDDLIEVIGSDIDLVKLKQCYLKWRAKGFKKTNYAWASDWYVDGIPDLRKGKENGKNHQHSGQHKPTSTDRLAEHREVIDQYPTEAELRNLP